MSVSPASLVAALGFEIKTTLFARTAPGEGCRVCGAPFPKGERRWVGAYTLNMSRWSLCLTCVPEASTAAAPQRDPGQWNTLRCAVADHAHTFACFPAPHPSGTGFD